MTLLCIPDPDPDCSCSASSPAFETARGPLRPALPFRSSPSVHCWRREGRTDGRADVLEDWRQRPKGLLGDAEHVPGDVAEQGGLEEIPSTLVSLPACHNRGPLGNRVIHVLLHLRDEKEGTRESWIGAFSKVYNPLKC